MSSVKHGLLNLFDHATDCVWSLEDRIMYLHKQPPDVPEYAGYYPQGSGRRSVKPSTAHSYHAGRRRRKKARYSVRVDPAEDDDEGGFDLDLPPNRFRTRSVAIVAGYSPERLYSNMPPGAFVVESGVYKVRADKEWERPEPIYWKQVRYIYWSKNATSI